MPRLIDPAHLVGAAEIKERLGLAFAQTVHDWRARYDEFPEPVATLKVGMVWYWPDVDAWASANGRQGRAGRRDVGAATQAGRRAHAAVGRSAPPTAESSRGAKRPSR